MSGFDGLGGPDEIIAGDYGTHSKRVRDFYVPLLKKATRYDRVSGYFSSYGLCLAAQGLVEFIPGGGTMRLIVGAQLNENDVRAVERGQPVEEAVAAAILSGDLFKSKDALTRHRLQVLAWLVANGRLWIKVGLKMIDGLPVAATDDRDYFHHKFGIFSDDAGRQVAFIGSGNETRAGWVSNSESFWTVASWWGDQWWAAQGQKKVVEFERMWTHHDAGPGWTILDLPEAAHRELLRFAPPSAPSGPDPEMDLQEEQHVPPVPPLLVAPAGAPDPRLLALRDAPKTRKWTGVTTSGVELLPHQVAVVRRAVERWERGGWLFADEVGLGKTIEVGTVLRELVLSGLAKRVLLLVPAAVLGQWQEELSEKLALWVPRWDGGKFNWPDQTQEGAPSGPWASSYPIVLASSHLARRQAERSKLRAGGPWDVVVVDEAHHARRQGGKANGTPNALLRILTDLRNEQAWTSLLLASATPMQMHPHELWDLVDQFGLPEDWSTEARYESYFSEMRVDFESRQWNLLCNMVDQHIADPAAVPNPGLDRVLASPDTPQGKTIRRISRRGLDRGKAFALDEPARPYLDAWLLANNPIRDRTFRNTRDTLRAYQEAGKFPAVIPRRHVEDRFLDMTPQEYAAYERISSYIRRHYNAAQAAGGATRRALGFIMTIYRRRLTSSFEAMRCSLQRRSDVLAGRSVDLVTEDEISLLDDALDKEELQEARRSLLAGEIAELESFLAELANLPPDETKVLRLAGPGGLIDEAFRTGHRTVLVFSQYGDTVRYLRERLDQHYRGGVLAYTATGGWRRDPSTDEWVPVDKKTSKDLFRAGEEIKILIGTDSLSEGLNLQTCGYVINYDMPWNFTRVEQRIGRVDRIDGQPLVEVRNLFYDRTVEADIYKTITAGHDGFNWVVGAAQPVLGSLEGLIKDAALRDDGGHSVLDDAIPSYAQRALDVVRAQVEEAGHQAVRLDMLSETRGDFAGIEADWGDALTLDELSATLLDVPRTARQLVRHPEWSGVFLLDDAGGRPVAVTFDREVLNERSPDVRLLSYGDPLFDLVLERAGVDASTPAPMLGASPDGSVLTIAEQAGQLPLGDSL